MIKKILFATDLGAYTSYGLVHLEHLAQHLQASVTVVHAVPQLHEFASAVMQSYCSEQVKKEILESSQIEGLADALRDQVFNFLHEEAAGEQGLLSLVDEIVVSHGTPAAIILQEAERISADLIVVGSHGVDALDGRMLGSVAAKVLQLAKVPVYMVPMMHAGELYQSQNAKLLSGFR